jgi:hypothetical protein
MKHSSGSSTGSDGGGDGGNDDSRGSKKQGENAHGAGGANGGSSNADGGSGGDWSSLRDADSLEVEEVINATGCDAIKCPVTSRLAGHGGASGNCNEGGNGLALILNTATDAEHSFTFTGKRTYKLSFEDL